MPSSPIVAAVDFEPGSELAASLAAQLAERTATPLHLVHADVLYRSGTDGAPPQDAPSSAHRLRLERLAETLGAEGPTVAVERHVSAAAAILAYVARVEAQLLVVGTHGRTGLGRLLVGSVAEACVAAAPCPVLTVPPGATALPGPGAPVLVAVDFSARSAAALTAARALADLTGADIDLLHVIRDEGPYPVAPGVSISDVNPEAAAAARRRLLQFAEAEGAGGVTVHVESGPPGRVIAAVAAARGAGAIVVGTHGRTGLAALVGSVAAATLRRATCPVLTLTEAERLARPVRSALA